MSEDPRLAASRYRQERDAAAAGERGEASGERGEAAGEAGDRAERVRAASAVDRAAYVETAIQQAIRRGDFDDLPGAGKPIPGLGASHDPDWWIRRKIQTEQLTGLGPPALMLRVENAELEDRLDELTREEEVRATVDDFNRRVIEARRQLQGGPPVVTPTRDVEAEVAAWAERRRSLLAESSSDAAPPRRRWWRRTRG